MIPVTITDRAKRILKSGDTTKASEIWGARSHDGKWIFERLDAPSTPWMVTNVDVPGWSAEFGSLSKARAGAEAQLGLDLAAGLIRFAGLERPRRRSSCAGAH